jgi:hypothetical protein
MRPAANKGKRSSTAPDQLLQSEATTAPTNNKELAVPIGREKGGESFFPLPVEKTRLSDETGSTVALAVFSMTALWMLNAETFINNREEMPGP